MFRSCSLRPGFLLLGIIILVGPARVQDAPDEDGCPILCAPKLKIEPAVDAEPLTEAARVVALEGGQPVDTSRGGLATSIEFTLAMDIPTQWPRVELGLDAVWTPFLDTEENPFKGRSGSMTENPVELPADVSVTLLREENTDGWVGVDVALADEFGPAERPGADHWCTHKLALALEVAALSFHRFKQAGYLQGVEVEGSLDFAATGIPQAGDRFPDELFLDDASPWGLSFAVVLSLASLSP